MNPHDTNQVLEMARELCKKGCFIEMNTGRLVNVNCGKIVFLMYVLRVNATF